MNDRVVRHIIALLGTLLCLLVFAAGYIAGVNGWWWGAITVAFVYAIVFVLVDI